MLRRHCPCRGVILSVLPFLLAASAPAEDFVVNSYAPGHQLEPAIAVAPDGAFAVAWTSTPSPNPADDPSSIVARRFAADGTPEDEDFVVNLSLDHEEKSPTVAFRADASIVVAWTQVAEGQVEYDRVLQRSFPAGAAAGEPEQSMARGPEFIIDGFPALAGRGEHERLVWRRRDPGWPDYFIQESSAGQVNASTVGNRLLPRVSIASDGSFVVVWEEGRLPSEPKTHWDIFARRFSAEGVPLGTDFQVNTATTGWHFEPSVAHLADDSWVVAWGSWEAPSDDDSSFGIRTRRFAADGAPLGAELQANTETFGSQSAPAVAADHEGNYVVAWQTPSSGGGEIWAQVFTAAGRRLGPEFQVNTEDEAFHFNPAVAADAQGNYRVVWQAEYDPPVLTEVRASASLSFAGLFADGFESGSTGAWAAEFP